MFGELHQFLSFDSRNERREYWLGRLVQAKSPIRIDLFNFLPQDILGLVIDLEESNGSNYVLVVRWTNGLTFPCYQHSIYSHEEGK